jgi:rsbT co-antagonist protein RsbR
MQGLSLSFLQSVLERLPAVGVKAATTHRYILVNEAWCALYGLPREQILGKSDDELLDERAAAARREQEDRAITTGQAVTVADVIPRAATATAAESGAASELAMSVTISPMSEGGTAVTHLVLSAHDITEQKRTEQELIDQKEFIRQVIDTDPNLIFVKDRSGRFVLANQALADAFGVSLEQLLDRYNRDVHPNEEEVDGYSLVDRQVIATRKEVVLEESFSPAGKTYWFQTIKRPLIRPGGEVQVLAISVDITARKEAQARLEEVARELARKAEEAQREAEEKATLVRELDQKLAIIEAQHKEILSLSVPLLDVGGDVLGLPLIGAMNERRAQDVMDRLLQTIVERQVRHVIVDLTGIESVDTGAAGHLMRIASAVRLLGAKVILTGIRPSVAQILCAIGADLPGVVTMRTLRDALRACADGA